MLCFALPRFFVCQEEKHNACPKILQPAGDVAGGANRGRGRGLNSRPSQRGAAYPNRYPSLTSLLASRIGSSVCKLWYEAKHVAPCCNQLRRKPMQIVFELERELHIDEERTAGFARRQICLPRLPRALGRNTAPSALVDKQLYLIAALEADQMESEDARGSRFGLAHRREVIDR